MTLDKKGSSFSGRLKSNLRSVEITDENGTDVVLFGFHATDHLKDFARENLGKDIEFAKPLDRARIVYLWENNDFTGLVKALGL